MEMSVVYAILCAQKQYRYFLGVGFGRGLAPSPDYHNKLMYIPTQHPTFIPVLMMRLL